MPITRTRSLAPVNLARRDLHHEIMDDLKLDETSLRRALGGLDRLNRVSNVATILWRSIKIWAKKNNLKNVHVLDVACGSGSLLRGLTRLAMKNGIHLTGVGMDINPKTVLFAQNQSEKNFPGITFILGNALQNIPDSYDVVLSTLFLHHLSDGEATTLIRNMHLASSGFSIIHDLERSRLGYCLAATASRVLSRSPVVHTDALLSVRGAFSKNEVTSLLAKADIPSATIKKTWPCRMLISWEKSRG